MSTVDENKMKETLKTLVQNEPEKLSFFDGLGPQTDIPPFIPQTNRREESRSITLKIRRRRYAYSMAAVAACFVLFIGITIVGLAPDALSNSMNLQTSQDMAASAPAAAEEMPAMESEVEEEMLEMKPQAPQESEYQADESAAAEAPAAEEAPAEESAGGANSDVDEAAEDPDGRSAEETTEESDNIVEAEITDKIDDTVDNNWVDVALIIALGFAGLFVFLLIKRRRLR